MKPMFYAFAGTVFINIAFLYFNCQKNTITDYIFDFEVFKYVFTDLRFLTNIQIKE